MLGHGLWIQALIGKLLGSLKRLLGLDREAVWMHKGLYSVLANGKNLSLTDLDYGKEEALCLRI
jgi:hypothetical protein